MTSRAEVTSRYAKAGVKASRKDKGRILDAKEPRKQRRGKYSYDAVKVLQQVWAASAGQYGKYLAASMRI